MDFEKEKMSVVELKNCCTKRGLKVSGRNQNCSIV